VITDAATVARLAGVIRGKYGLEFAIVTFIGRLLARGGAKPRLILRIARPRRALNKGLVGGGKNADKAVCAAVGQTFEVDNVVILLADSSLSRRLGCWQGSGGVLAG